MRRIGLNLLYLRPGVVGGTETYAHGLLQGLADVATDERFVVFLNQSAQDWPLPSRFTRVVCNVTGASQGRRYLYEQTRLPGLAVRHRLDVMHSLGYVAPVWLPCAGVVTVHDLNYRAAAHAMPLVRRTALASFVTAAAHRSNAVIAVSRFTRDEILSAMTIDPAKVHVVHSAATPLRQTEASGGQQPPGPYFLAFSSQAPNKNLPRLLRAFSVARERYGVTHTLVLVGHRPAAVCSDTPGAVWTGYVPGPHVAALLAGADAMLFPSLYEGFGLPALDAMRAGVALACSDRTALPEVAGDAALYFNPESVDEMAVAMETLARDTALRAQLIARGYARVGTFSWRRAARETLAVYRAVA